MPITFSQSEPVSPEISALGGAAQADLQAFPTLANLYATVSRNRQEDANRQLQAQQFLLARLPSQRDQFEALNAAGLQQQRLNQQAQEFLLGREPSNRDLFGQQAEAQQQVLKGQIQGQLQQPDIALRANQQQQQGQEFLLGQQQQAREFMLGRQPSDRDAWLQQQQQQELEQRFGQQQTLQEQQHAHQQMMQQEQLQQQQQELEQRFGQQQTLQEQQHAHQQMMQQEQFQQQQQELEQRFAHADHMQQQSFDLQGQLSQTQLSQAEQMRLQRLQSVMDAINDPNNGLDDDARRDALLQAQTGHDPLARRQQQAALLHMQQESALQKARFLQQTAMHSTHLAYMNRNVQDDLQYITTEDGSRIPGLRDAQGNFHEIRQHQPGVGQPPNAQTVERIRDHVTRSMQAAANNVTNPPPWAAGGQGSDAWNAEHNRQFSEALAASMQPSQDQPFDLNHPERASPQQRQALTAIYNAGNLAARSNPQAAPMIQASFQRVMSALARRGSAERMSPEERVAYEQLWRQLEDAGLAPVQPRFNFAGPAAGTLDRYFAVPQGGGTPNPAPQPQPAREPLVSIGSPNWRPAYPPAHWPRSQGGLAPG